MGYGLKLFTILVFSSILFWALLAPIMSLLVVSIVTDLLRFLFYE